MYNLLVKSNGWSESRDDVGSSRVLEYTEEHLKEQFKTNGNFDFNSLVKLPCLFMQETWRDESQQNARVGTIINAAKSGENIKIEYAFDSSVPTLNSR